MGSISAANHTFIYAAGRLHRQIKPRLLSALCACILAFTSITTSAALSGRLETAPGSDVFHAYYDADLNKTWLTEANYSGTSGYTDPLYTFDADGTGEMIFQDALDWVNQLSIGGNDEWHLPTQADMEHLHYIELGYLLYSDPNWLPGDENSDPFIHVGSNHYWSSQPGLIFNFREGTSNSSASLDQNYFHAWAIADGDPFAPDGDINLDGVVNAADVLLGQQVLNDAATLSPLQFVHGDVAPLVDGLPSPDGLFTAGDLLVIERKALEAIDF